MTITSLSSNYYTSYQVTSDFGNSNYSLVEQSLTNEKYGLNNISNALDTMTDTEANQYMSISSAYEYSKSQLTLSQLSIYDTLTAEDDDIDLNSITNVSSSASSSYQYEQLLETYTDENSYTSYLSNIGTNFDSSL